MRTIGIDPGTALMGWGVIDTVQSTPHMVAYGAIKTPPTATLGQRLLLLYTELTALLVTYEPTAAAVEELFFSRNVKTALAVGHARGVILLTLAQAHLPAHEYKPLEVKQAVAGYGGADKRQMQEMVRLTLRLEHIPRPDDAADALAIALCHTYAAPMKQRIAESTA